MGGQVARFIDMKIQIETLNKVEISNDKFIYEIDESKTIVMQTLKKAKDKFKTMSATEDKKIRIIEYRNDEPDETRKPCKVIVEK